MKAKDTLLLNNTITQSHFSEKSLILVCCITYINRCEILPVEGVTLAQLVKASVGQADVQRFEPHLGHNWLSCGVFPVKSRHFRLPLAQTTRPNWQSL